MSHLAFTARRATGLSQRQFAALLDVHPRTVARWESGEAVLTTTARSLLLLVRAHPGLCYLELSGRRGASDASRRQ